VRLLSVGIASQSKATLTNQDVLGRLAERFLFATEIKVVASNMEFNEIHLFSVICTLLSFIFVIISTKILSIQKNALPL